MHCLAEAQALRIPQSLGFGPRRFGRAIATSTHLERDIARVAKGRIVTVRRTAETGRHRSSRFGFDPGLGDSSDRHSPGNQKYRNRFSLTEMRAMIQAWSPKPRLLAQPLRPQGLARGAPDRGPRKLGPSSLSKGTLSAAGRNKMAVNPLKTNDPAKSMISRPNDINDLRPASRNLSFRLAKHSVRFRCFRPSSTPETQTAATGALATGNSGRGGGLRTSWPEGSQSRKSCAKEV